MAASKPKSTAPATQPETAARSEEGGAPPAGAAQTSEVVSTPTDTGSTPPAGQEQAASASSGGAGPGNDHLVPVGDVRSDGAVQTPELLGQATDAWMAAQAAAAATPLPISDPVVITDPVVDQPPTTLELLPAVAEVPPPGEVRVPVGFLADNDVSTPGTRSRETIDPELVTVYAPSGFTLTLDDHTPVVFKQGRNENVQLAHARHWYCAAQGVRPIEDGE